MSDHYIDFKVFILSFLTIVGIEGFKQLADITAIVLQLIIGVLTIIYLIKKIRK